MPKKITIIGSGSHNFTNAVVRDILTFPALADAHFVLMDINAARLDSSRQCVQKLIDAGKYPATVVAEPSQAKALEGADAVICTIRSNPIDITRRDIEIPAKYNVSINVGDTRGPSGVFRALRTLPHMMSICADIEKYCPDAYLINYTNPMTILTKAMLSRTRVKAIGICHSVQGTARKLAKWIDTPMSEITYLCAGINHQAWFLEFKKNGQDAYPLIRQAVLEQPEVYNAEIVRNEMFLHLDYYVTESSGHNSEYNAWFRKRPDLIEKYCNHGTGSNPGIHADSIRKIIEREATRDAKTQEWLKSETVDLARGHEYASSILNAVIGDGTLYEFNGNVSNFGLIDNLPEGSCVEVPVLASKRGLSPIHVGKLPAQLAILNNNNAMCEDLAVEGYFAGDPRMIYHAICYDPLTAAVLSLDEIKKMVDEMFEANAPFLPTFNK